MTKKAIIKQIVLVIFLFTQNVFGQKSSSLKEDSISIYFKEIKTATKKNTRLWNKNLYGSILLVNPQTRQIFSNESDSDNLLKSKGTIYSGILPESINIANTSIKWNGKNWAMIMLPLPQNKQDRINLLAHELYHRSQSSLGFTQYNKESNHLDQKEGRIYLRLELEALKKAIFSTSDKEQKLHFANALIFRKYRNSLFDGSDTLENQLELNEGIAEFTGVIISGRNKKQMAEHFLHSINDFFKNPTYVRSFAYYTTPVYGYLLYEKDRNWNKEITSNTNLANFFISKFNLVLPKDLKNKVMSLSDDYNGNVIFQEEQIREEKIQKLITEYKTKLIEQPHFEIQFEKMSVSFDPRNIIPIEDRGTVYPNIRVSDIWGVLEVEKGALMSPNWNKISITNPTKIDGNKITGDGWILKLKEGYTLKKDETTNNYKLNKN